MCLPYMPEVKSIVLGKGVVSYPYLSMSVDLMRKFGVFVDTSSYELVHEEPTEPGKYIVFHPTIIHESTPNTSNEDRITMACDAFPDGLINKGATSRLNVRLL